MPMSLTTKLNIYDLAYFLGTEEMSTVEVLDTFEISDRSFHRWRYYLTKVGVKIKVRMENGHRLWRVDAVEIEKVDALFPEMADGEKEDWALEEGAGQER